MLKTKIKKSKRVLALRKKSRSEKDLKELQILSGVTIFHNSYNKFYP